METQVHAPAVAGAPAAMVTDAERDPPPHRIEAFVEGGLQGVLVYLRKLCVTTRDQLLHPFRFAASHRAPAYCRPATYLVLALLCDTLLTTTLLGLERAGADSVIDRDATKQLARDIGTGALAGDWMQLLRAIAPLLALLAVFAGFLALFARRRHGGDFGRAFAVVAYAVGAADFLRVLLMLSLLPAMAAAAGTTAPASLQAAKAVLWPAVAVLQVYPVLPLLVHLRAWTGGWRSAAWCWLRAGVCTLLVAATLAAWSYPLWQGLLHLPGPHAAAIAPAAGSRAY